MSAYRWAEFIVFGDGGDGGAWECEDMTFPDCQAHPKIADPKGVTVRPSIDHAAAVVRLIDAVLGATTTTRELREASPQH